MACGLQGGSRDLCCAAAVSFVLACSSPKALVLILRARVMCRIASLCKPCCSSLSRHTQEECRVQAAAGP